MSKYTISDKKKFFELGPKKAICAHSLQAINMLYYETQPILKSNYVYAIFEQKILSKKMEHLSEIEKEIESLLSSLADNLKKHENFLLKKPINESVLDVNLILYWPEVYLKGQFLHYLNHSEKNNPIKILNDTGFYCLNITLNSKDIKLILNKPEHIFNSLKNSYKSIDKFNKKLSNHLTSFMSVKGHIKQSPWSGIANYSIDSNLKQLQNIPLYNISPESSLSNTRDFNKDRLISLFNELSDTFCRNFTLKKKKLSLEQIYTSTGIQPREVAYNANKTIVIAQRVDYSDNWQDNMTGELIYVSSDISMVDGQHSTLTIIDMLNMLDNKQDAMSPQGIGFVQAKNIFERHMKKHHLKSKDEILNFLLNEQLIEINIKGFYLPSLAVKFVQNKKHIYEYTEFEKLFNLYKPYFKTLIYFINAKQKMIGQDAYVPNIKESFSNLLDNKTKKLNIDYFIAVACIIDLSIPTQKNDYFKAQAYCASFNLNWKKARAFYFKKSAFINLLYELLTIRKKYNTPDEDFFSEIIQTIHKSFEKLTQQEQIGITEIIKKIESIQDTATKDDIDEQVNLQYSQIENTISIQSLIKEDTTIWVSNFIYSFLTYCDKENLNILFNNEKDGLIYLISLLKERYSYIQDTDQLLEKLMQAYPTSESFNKFFKEVNIYLAKNLPQNDRDFLYKFD